MTTLKPLVFLETIAISDSTRCARMKQTCDESIIGLPDPSPVICSNGFELLVKDAVDIKSVLTPLKHAHYTALPGTLTMPH